MLCNASTAPWCWYGKLGTRPDASLLLIPPVGFLPSNDPQLKRTLRVIEENLLVDGEFVPRYETVDRVDSLPACGCPKVIRPPAGRAATTGVCRRKS
jgi:hypothetical protein